MPPTPPPPKPGRVAVPPVVALSDDPLLGQTVARCRIEARIGGGRTSVVYRATHGSLGVPVAVKLLKPAVLAFPEIVAKFEVEARAIAKLDHPNVLKIYDVVAEGDRHAIVMELLEGESVLDLLSREERLDPVDALRIVRQAASGLAAAHAKGIIHRDVKPQNLVVLPDGTVKLVDFGLATAADSAMASSRIGTPHYMAPEVCEARPAEPKSDVYSLGVSLYHLLVGTPPYAGMSVREILASHVEGKPLHPERRLPGLPKPVCALVREMTKRDPLLRPTAQQVVEETDRAGGKALATSPRLRVGRRRAPTPKRSSNAGVVVVVGVVVLGLLVLLLARSGGSSAPAPGPTTSRTPPPAEPATEAASATPPTPPPASEPRATTPPPTRTPEPAPIPPPETEEQRRAREEAAAETRRTQAEYAFSDTESFARANWQDKAAVVREYRKVASLFRDVEEVAKRAKERADGIEKGKVHPHPDKAFAPPSEVETAKAQWGESKPEYEKALAEMRFLDAERLVPPRVDDRDLAFAEELEFHRRVAKDSSAFLDALAKDVDALPAGERKIPTPKGEARIVGRQGNGLKVEVGDERTAVFWNELKPADLLALADKAFKKNAQERAVLVASFAYATRQRDAFFRAALTIVSGSPGTPDEQHANRGLARADAWFKAK
jgi:serine/threonine-protein kinase